MCLQKEVRSNWTPEEAAANRAYQKTWQDETREQRIAAKKCTQCGVNDANDGQKCCEECLVAAREARVSCW